MTTTPKPPPTARALRRVQRDSETIELFKEFLAASDVGLTRAEELLGRPQHTIADAELAHELSRVFEAIAGVSGVLKALDVTRLAHATGVLLGGARAERYSLSGPVLQALVDAIKAMRRLLTLLRRAVELDVQIRPDPLITGLIAQLEATAAATDRQSDARAQT